MEHAGPRFYQHYEILTRPDGRPWELGRGAMGVTYKARDINLETPVALKIIDTRFSIRPDARQRFLREAQAAARLQHPNVARVFHFGTINTLPAPDTESASARENAEAGDCFYAMEFVEGETLEARLRRLGPIPPQSALEIALQVARALTAAERCGLVHRDLTPSNIMLVGEDEEKTSAFIRSGEPFVKVIDFGLAQARDDHSKAHGSRFSGTPAFSSPEQLAGGEVDIRSDIYSLGAALWYSQIGTVPFPDRSAQEQGEERGRRLPVERLRERAVPPSVIRLLERMLAHEPAARPSSAVALVEEIQRCLAELCREEPRGPRILATPRRRATALALAVAAGLVALAVYFFIPQSSIGDKSIAVLPFKNLTQDPGEAVFAEGLEEDLLSTLVKIRDLKVISRLSASRYPADKPRDLEAIGRALGVRHVVEGKLRRIRDRVLLNIALIDTITGRQLWAERYDRTMADAVTLQGDLAHAIATALDATLTKREQADVATKPTGNPDAYVLYLHGRKFDTSPVIAIGDYEAAAALYRQAIALDPGFALAHSRLGATLAFLYRFRGPSEELKKEAYAEIAKALSLRPNLGQAHLDRGLAYYRIERDFDRALPELEIARQLLPNDTEAESFIAYINRRRGNWREAQAGLERIRQRDPRNSMYAEELYTSSYLVRNWSAARRYISEAEAIEPLTVYKVERALVDLWQNGDLRPLQKEFAELKGYGDPEGSITWLRWDTAMMARDFAAAQAALDAFPGDTLPCVYSAPVPKSYMEGCIALAQGDKTTAQKFFEAARPAMEAESIAHPENALRHARLGLLFAYMGREENALREGRRAVELNPAGSDAYEGPEQVCNLALIHARLGHADRALELIRSQLRQPGGVFFYESSMSLWELRLRWQWDPLRSDPRFQAMLAAPEPETVY